MEVRGMAAKKVGSVEHYYDHIGVALVKFTGTVKVGETIKFIGKSGEFTQTVDSLEFEHQKVQSAKKGDSLGLKVDQKVREGDLVYKIT